MSCWRCQGIPISSWLMLCLVAASMPVAGELGAEEAPVDFAGDVYPILRRACFECHGARKQEGDLRLDRRADLFESGTIEPGHPDDSELLRRIMLPHGHDEVMPAIGETLRRREVAKIRRWIAQGARWPERFQAPRHWAYRVPRRPAIPQVLRLDWAKSDLDLFVLRRLEREGLAPSSRAEPETLVRRLFLDLIGLPPSPSEIDAFLSDPSDAATARLVDELLERPQFGERWARPWLDLARYADSHGFQRDDWRSVWAYRDWVIRALNADMPFDQFTIEQIAGDQLPDATESQRTATGFHRCTPTNVEAGSLPEETRVEQVIDRVNTTGAVWLGTTLECAQCHDHKYDPFTMKDYYGLLAFFNSTEMEADRTNPATPSSIAFRGPSMPLSDAVRDRRRAEEKQRLAALQVRRATRHQELAAALETWVSDIRQRIEDAAGKSASAGSGSPETSGAADVPQEIFQLATRAPSMWSSDDRRKLVAYRTSRDDESRQIADEIARTERQIEDLAPHTTLIMRELASPRPSAVFGRGDYRKPGEPVEPRTPQTLHAMPDGPPSRLALARWLVDPANPLVARVTVNRWWAELFGSGIVATAEDFGFKGELPTHPELLDWLAVEFMESGWSMKHLLKTVVLSATYQQSSRVTPELLATDDLNRLLARGPRFRLEAEMIRDNALAISGLLDLKQFGPPVRPPQPAGVWEKIGGTAYNYVVSPGSERHRRGIYVILKRGAPYPSFVNFDAPARLTCTVKRSRTNTPMQALTLLNDPVYVEATKAFVFRLLDGTETTSFEEKLKFAFRICTARCPTDKERNTLASLFDAQLAASRQDGAAAMKLLGEHARDSIPAAEFAAWYSVATVLLNMHATITKE